VSREPPHQGASVRIVGESFGAHPLAEVRRNETLRLKVRNAGAVLHELVIGTDAELKEHAGLVKKFPGKAHDEPCMARVEAGMIGRIVVRD
jgi:uncharacterized cupredoxin-like copper-binding protein